MIANPPYISYRVAGKAPTYATRPFYQDALAGEINTYLLFLRLASYYCAVGGTICYIVPLTLLADESSEKVRQTFANDNWTISNITRFFTETVLFNGVTQSVCVVCFLKQPADDNYPLTLSGGHDVEEAQQPADRIVADKRLVTDAHSMFGNPDWQHNWLVTNRADDYAVWKHIRDFATSNVRTIVTGKLDFTQGDVNATHVNPLRTSSLSNSLPLTKGELVRNFGGWSTEARVSYLPIANNTSRYGPAVDAAQKKIKRIAELVEPETVVLLRQVANVAIRRRINGTVLERNRYKPVVADNTIWSLRASSSNSDLAYALFALLTSSTSNYVFGLFSTNNHINKPQILRTPIPVWTTQIEKQLAGLARAAMKAGLALDSFRQGYGGEVTINVVLKGSGLPTQTLAQAVSSGLLSSPRIPSQKVSTLAANGQLAVAGSSDPAYVAGVNSLLAECGIAYNNAANTLQLPRPAVVATLQTQVAAARNQLTSLQAALDQAVQAIDDAVFDWYKITNPAWRDLINRGMPWSV